MPENNDKQSNASQKPERKPDPPKRIDFSIPSTENQGKKKSEPKPTEDPVKFHKRNDDQ